MTEEQLSNYYENPNYCKYCGKIIEGTLNQRLFDLKVKIFCTRSCAASFNGKGKIKNPNGNNQTGKHDSVNEKKICPNCGQSKDSRADLCKSCWDEQDGVSYKTLGFYIKNYKYLTTKCSRIRSDARRVLERSKREKVCEKCKNHEFDEILEVHHKKGILEFSKETLINVINSEENLVWLCPNHHALIEKYKD